MGSATLPGTPRSIAARHVCVDGAFVPATLRVEGTVIAAIGAFDAGTGTVLPDDAVVLRGPVDSHVHLDEPGRTEREGFATGTAVAGGGGEAQARRRRPLPVRSGAREPRLAADARRSGRRRVHVLPQPSGIDEFGHLDQVGLHRALDEVAAFDGVLIVHAEDPAHLRGEGPLRLD